MEFRYGSDEMRRLFSRENILVRMIDVEVSLIKGLEECGLIPEGSCAGVIECARSVDVATVEECERRLGHEVMGLAVAIAEVCGERGRYVHYGATSNDVIDTVWALTLREALRLVRLKLVNLINLLIKLSRNYSTTLMVGRTHAQHALPITLGFKFANYVYEFTRSLDRLMSAESRVVLGKMAGAVGTMAGWQDRGLCVESVVMRELGLRPHLIATQVAPRDGFAELISSLAIVAAQAERLGIEVRELMRPEIMELAEGVKGRVGSSTMPHKENPVLSEKLAGLAKLLRGLVITALENIPLWHERDLSNSSSERLLIPHAFLVVDEILETAIKLLEDLRIYPERMLRNIELSRGAIVSEALVLRLTDKGMRRHEAYELVKELVNRALSEGTDLHIIASTDVRVTKYLSQDEIREVLDYRKYLGSYAELMERAINYAEEVMRRASQEVMSQSG
ncbi:MAG: adenylosuccinate lyase [Zestosphaera sp.]